MPNFNDFGCGNSECKKRFRCDKYVNYKEYQVSRCMDDFCGEVGNYDYFKEIKSDYNDSYLELLKMNQDLQERLESREIYLALTSEQRDIAKEIAEKNKWYDKSISIIFEVDNIKQIQKDDYINKPITKDNKVIGVITEVFMKNEKVVIRAEIWDKYISINSMEYNLNDKWNCSGINIEI